MIIQIKFHYLKLKLYKQTRIPPSNQFRKSGDHSWPSNQTSYKAAWLGVHGNPLQKL